MCFCYSYYWWSIRVVFGETINSEQLSMIISFAAGALMAFITEELIPQAYKRVELHIGLSSSFGFIIALALFHYM
jgi:zinc transporter ZupT